MLRNAKFVNEAFYAFLRKEIPYAYSLNYFKKNFKGITPVRRIL